VTCLPCLHRRCAAWAAALPAWLLALGLAVVLAAWAPSAQSASLELRDVEVQRGEDGLVLGFGARFELPRSVEDALLKGVPLHFMAEAKTYRSRWYWRDQRVAKATRTWRLAYQPLTRRYRVTFGSLNQNFESLADALSAIQRVSRWKVADASQLEPGERHYVELSYRLDTTELPRPFQIGIGGQADWELSAESVLVLQDPT
jgi:hypothetical protein